MITYTWKVLSIKTRKEGENDGFVYQTHWKKIGTDENGNTGEAFGGLPLSPSENEVFTPLEQLTEEQVIEWIKAGLSEGAMSMLDKEIEKQIALKTSAVTLEQDALPWSPPPAEAPVADTSVNTPSV